MRAFSSCLRIRPEENGSDLDIKKTKSHQVHAYCWTRKTVNLSGVRLLFNHYRYTSITIDVFFFCVLKNRPQFKGTIRPDWTYMRVVPMDRPWRGHQPQYVLDFLNFTLEFWKDLKVLSCFMQKLIQPPACSDHGLHRILSSYWLVHFYLMTKSAKELLYIGLDCEMLEFFTPEQ